MTKFRFQITGTMEFGADMSINDVNKWFSSKLVGAEIVGSTIYKLKEKRAMKD